MTEPNLSPERDLEEFATDIDPPVQPGGMLSAQLRRPRTWLSFDLAAAFSESFAREHPQMLAAEAVDAAFEAALCRLDADRALWAGSGPTRCGRLRSYLRRYAVMFYDADFGPGSMMAGILRDFMNRHRGFRFPDAAPRAGYADTAAICGVAAESLRAMSRQELTRARNLH